MTYPENPTNTAAFKASDAEFDRWNMYGEFTTEELYGPSASPEPKVERLAPNVAAWDKVLSQVLGREQ